MVVGTVAVAWNSCHINSFFIWKNGVSKEIGCRVIEKINLLVLTCYVCLDNTNNLSVELYIPRMNSHARLENKQNFNAVLLLF